MKPSDIPKIEGISTTLQELNWKGLELDVMRQTITLPTGTDFIVYGIQYPLSGEAVQLQVGGPIQQDGETYKLFTQVAQSFGNTRPLPGANGVSLRTLSTQECIEKLGSGIIRLTITGIVIIFIFRLVKRAFSKSKG